MNDLAQQNGLGNGVVSSGWLGETAKVVNETDDFGQGYSENKFGFCIGDRVWWVGMEGYGHDEERAKQQKALCREIVRRWNAPNNVICEPHENPRKP